MQINSSTIATFGGGLAVGVVIGIFAEVAFEKWQDRKAEEAATIVNPVEEDAVSDIVEEDADGSGKPEPHGDVLGENPDIESKSPDTYSRQYKIYKREESDKPVFEGESDIPSKELDRSRQIVISAEEYMNGKGSYDKIECTYAEDENGMWVLTNDDGNVEMDVTETIGEAALGYFRREPDMDDGEGVVYVRNDVLGADYCVMKYPYVE